MEFGQVHHIEYYVNNLQKSNEFWSWFMPKLNYNKSSEWDQGISWSHKNGTYIVFVQVQKNFLSTKNERQANGLNHIAFQGGNKEFLDKLQQDLEQRGIKILKRLEDYICFEECNKFAVEVYASEAPS